MKTPALTKILAASPGILENQIVNALKFFGPMTKEEILEKLAMIGSDPEMRDLDQAVSGLLRNKMIREGEPKGIYVAL